MGYFLQGINDDHCYAADIQPSQTWSPLINSAGWILERLGYQLAWIIMPSKNLSTIVIPYACLSGSLTKLHMIYFASRNASSWYLKKQILLWLSALNAFDEYPWTQLVIIKTYNILQF